MAYVDNMRSAIMGNLAIDSVKPDSAAFVPLDTAALLAPSPRETEFMARYSAHEGFSIDSTLTVVPDAPAFVAPVRGIVVEPRGKTSEPRFITDSQFTDIYAIARGGVVSVSADTAGLKTIVLQHPDGYLSVYQNLQAAYPSAGAEITSGQKIGRYRQSPDAPLRFSLFRDGLPINPFQYILF